jgi:DNA-binding GntR family transcriptional regulator
VAKVASGNRLAVYDQLRAAIINLDIEPGALISENDLTARLGVSRTPVREALIVLAKEGFVQIVPKVGTFVSRVSFSLVRDAQFLRETVELAALDDLPTDLDSDLIAQLQQNLATQSTDLTPTQFFALDEQFHKTLMTLSGHGGSWAAVASAKGHLDRARMLGLGIARPISTLVTEHHGVLDAVMSHRIATAKNVLRGHLRAVFAELEQIRDERPNLFADDLDATPTRKSVAVWV